MDELPADRRAHQEWLVSLTALPSSGLALDLGCGKGGDLRAIAARHPSPGLRFAGIDRTESAAWKEASAHDPRLAFVSAPLDGRLAFDDASVDLVFAHNLLECLGDARGFAREVARILKPGGQAVIAHWDWDTQLWDGSDKAIVRRLVASFADWQQAWMPHADRWTGRRLGGIFNGIAGLDGAVQSRMLMNSEFSTPHFGHANAGAMSALVRRGLADRDEHARFLLDQETLQAGGRYFYGITGFAWVGVRTGLR